MTCLGVLDRGERDDDNETRLKQGGLIEISSTVLHLKEGGGIEMSTTVLFHIRDCTLFFRFEILTVFGSSWTTLVQSVSKFKSEMRVVQSRIWKSTVVDIYIPPSSCKLVSLSLSCSSLI